MSGVAEIHGMHHMAIYEESFPYYTAMESDRNQCKKKKTPVPRIGLNERKIVRRAERITKFNGS